MGKHPHFGTLFLFLSLIILSGCGEASVAENTNVGLNNAGLVKNGSRLTELQNIWTGDDGTRATEPLTEWQNESIFQDQTMGVRCTVVGAADESLRCLPEPKLSLSDDHYFADPACTKKVGLLRNDAISGKPKYLSVSTSPLGIEYCSLFSGIVEHPNSLLDYEYRVYQVSQILVQPTIIYRSDLDCAPIDIYEGYSAFTLGAEVAPSKFVGFSIKIGTTGNDNTTANHDGSRLTRKYFELNGDDGTHLTKSMMSSTGFYDQKMDTFCVVQTAADGLSRCVPESYISSAYDQEFSDSSCTNMAVLLRSERICGKPPKYLSIYHFPSDYSNPQDFCVQMHHVYKVVGSSTKRYTYDDNGNCVFKSIPEGNSVLTLGPEVAPTEFVAFSVADQ